ncbi:hypothetical protein NPIL_52301 [Nephila pilipes]|uniref:Uncharacterized protein n=1 Tax=Nephila pilipes TaxID=299642 RepID=A0A8X6PAJ3_NEPPI|nr:hypothetical protein NPIL_52301 [Nephila pilipes]
MVGGFQFLAFPDFQPERAFVVIKTNNVEVSDNLEMALDNVGVGQEGHREWEIDDLPTFDPCEKELLPLAPK